MDKKAVIVISMFALICVLAILNIYMVDNPNFKWFLVISPVVFGVVSFFILKGDKVEENKGITGEKQDERGLIEPKKEDLSLKDEAITAEKDIIDLQRIAIIQIMGLLQREGRFLDFIQEDIDKYDDAQVGAAVRSLHKGCKSVIEDTFGLRPVIDAPEGSEIEVDAHYDPMSIKLIGKIKGKPPFMGTLIHPGWKIGEIKMAKWTGEKTDIVYPAEIEVK